MAEFAFNNKVHTATKMSPFQVNYGKEPRMGFDIRKKGKNEKAEEFVREIKERHEEARAALVKLQEEMKRQADRSRKEAEEYRVGDKVLISIKDFSMELMKRVTKKLTEKFIGPYVVRKIVLENMVELELPALLRVHPVVNMRRLVKYQEQVEGQKKIPPLPVDIDGEKEYEVEEILDRQERRGKTMSRLLMVDFIHFYFLSFILFFFVFYFLFSIFRTTWVRRLLVMLSYQSQFDGIVIRLITGLRRMK